MLSNGDDYNSGFHHFADNLNRQLKAGFHFHGQLFNINHVLCHAMGRD